MDTVRPVWVLLPAILADARVRRQSRRRGGRDAGVREVGSVPLPGVEGRFDHFAVDLKGKRLFVAALGNDTVEVIDLAPEPRTPAASEG